MLFKAIQETRNSSKRGALRLFYPNKKALLGRAFFVAIAF